MTKRLEAGMGISRRDFSKTSLGAFGSLYLANAGLTRATGMTEGAKAENNSATHPYPEGDRGDLWLLGGQSNMFGNARLLEELAPDPRILIYSHTNEWKIAKDPLDFF